MTKKTLVPAAAFILAVSSHVMATPTLPVPVPAKGQKPEQVASDKTACYAEAKATTGYDPSAAPVAAVSTEPQKVSGKDRVKSSAKKSAKSAAAGAAIG